MEQNWKVGLAVTILPITLAAVEMLRIWNQT